MDMSLDSPARLGLPPRHRGLLHPRTRRMLDVRGRTVEALACVDTAMIRRSVARDRLTIGTDFVRRICSPPVPQPTRSSSIGEADVEVPGSSRFGRFKKRVAWRAERSIKQGET